MGQVAFSLQLEMASNKINARSLLEKKSYRDANSLSPPKQSAIHKASIPSEARIFPLEVIGTNLKSAYQEYYAIKWNGKTTRDTSQDNLAEALAA
jgi:hypothetical protein